MELSIKFDYVKTTKQLCGGWRCSRIFEQSEIVAERYCSQACYQDYEARKVNGQWNNWDSKVCACGCNK
jgi:hypothetical protein